MYVISRHLMIIIALPAMVLPVAPAEAQDEQRIEFSDAAVARAIEKGKAWFWAKYRSAPGESPWEDKASVMGPGRRPVRYVNYGGQSALATYALLSAGEKISDPRMKRAVHWLSQLETEGTYTLGIRMQVWAMLPKEMGRTLLAKDCARLVRSAGRPPADGSREAWSHHYGSYTYASTGKPATNGDHSNMHFGVLGVWAAARSGIDVDPGYWDLIHKHYVKSQSSDGTWRYNVGPGKPARNGSYGQFPPGGMTAAGLANLMIAWESLHAKDFIRCGRNPDSPAIKRALDWLDRNFGRHANGYHYYLYALERVSFACGHKFFGDRDWYKICAERLLTRQHADGGWGKDGFGDQNNFVATAFALIFLARGRNPIMFNRLQYEGDWNNRPRALAGLTRWVSGEFEREINWQIVNIDTPVKDWHDAPVLLITGAKRPRFDDRQIEKLRRFVQQGGTIFTVAECQLNGAPFNEAWRGRDDKGGLYAKLFPDYEFKRLEPNHPLFQGQLRVAGRHHFWGVSNGVRMLAVHTNEDLPLLWQTGQKLKNEDPYHIPVNLALLVNDLALGRPRGTSPWPSEKPVVPTRVNKVVRIRHGGRWDPEPLAWERMRILMRQQWRTRLILDTQPPEKLSAATFRVAHMTGTGTLTMTGGAKKALKDYVNAGGTLIVDAAGGDKTFAADAEKLLDELFDDPGRRLPIGSDVWRMPGLEIDSVRYRRATRARIAADRRPRVVARTVGGRTAVFYSREDITCGLVGYASSTCDGYASGETGKPGSAVLVMRNLIRYAHRARPPGK